MNNARIIALPAKPIAGPVSTKIAPPIISAMPTIMMSVRLLTHKLTLVWVGVLLAGHEILDPRRPTNFA